VRSAHSAPTLLDYLAWVKVMEQQQVQQQDQNHLLIRLLQAL
jgi:hypothetical protein